MKSLAYLFLCIILIPGCASSPQKDYEKIPIGSDKGYVLHLLGNPDRTYRKSSVDRWVYYFRSEDSTNRPAVYEKEIWFENGKVVYKDKGGEPKSERRDIGPQRSDYEPI
ncbi:MAG: hypothetical protein K2Q26_09700 [Bdellovibrionales bacterium]|nr:hypothetical protein [Bdellovibrionales bacterium]